MIHILRKYQVAILSIGIAALASLFVWICHVRWNIPDTTLTVLLISIVAGLTVFYLITKKFSVQGYLFVIALVTGFYGFKFLAYKDYSDFNALYSTFRLFILDVDNVFTKDASKFTELPQTIEIARWSAAACTISTIFLFVYKLLGQSVKLFLYGIWGRHIVISGFNDKSKTLIENLQKQGRKVVLLTEEIQDAQMDYLQRLGAVVMVGKHGESRFYKKSKLNRAEYIIFFHEDDSRNLNELLLLNKYTNSSWDNLNAKQIIVHLANRQSYILYEDIEAELGQMRDGTFIAPPIRIINLHRLTAEKLLNEKPLYQGYEHIALNPVSDALHILIVGFGSMGQQIAVQAMERNHFINGKNLRLTILDKDIEKVKKSWYQSYPKSKKVADIFFETHDVETSYVKQAVADSVHKITHIFFCLNSDFLDMIEGIELAKKYPDIPIFIKMTEEVQVSKWLDKNEEIYKNVHLFGDVDAVLNEDFIINENLEDVAKKIHEMYRIKKEKKTRKQQLKWEEMTDFFRESNRNQSNHMETKLMLMGFSAIKKSQDNQNVLTEAEFLQSIEHLVDMETMAAIEHARWNAFYYLRGWDALPEIRDKETKDLARKLHACMVPFEELDRIKLITCEDYKEYDRETIRKLHACMEEKGYSIIKSTARAESSAAV